MHPRINKTNGVIAFNITHFLTGSIFQGCWWKIPQISTNNPHICFKIFIKSNANSGSFPTAQIATDVLPVPALYKIREILKVFFLKLQQYLSPLRFRIKGEKSSIFKEPFTALNNSMFAVRRGATLLRPPFLIHIPMC